MLRRFFAIVHASSRNPPIAQTRTCTSAALRSRKPKSKIQRDHPLVDRCRVRTVGGSGGDGYISFLQLWCNERAGPDGGDGGNGGHVIFLATEDISGLNHCTAVLEAESGKNGATKDMHGKSAKHNFVNVPVGTVIRNVEGTIVGDLYEKGMMFIAARGGAGGKGNSFFKSDTEQAPSHAEYGALGETISYILEIKSMAHVGLLGFPNAGKSTLLRAISRARPKVAPYPFTTLKPYIGMIQYDDYEQIAVADLPGLIPGSHENRGLGIQFLQHVERCCCLMYVVDLSTEKPWEQFECLQYELSQFSKDLVDRPQLIIGNKIDVPVAQTNLPLFQQVFKDIEILPISAKVGTNLSILLKKIREVYDAEFDKNKN